MKIDKILVPIDFSEPSGWALDHGLKFARHFGARLILLHVAKSSPHPMLPAEAAILQKQDYSRARELLSALVKIEDRKDLDIRFEVKSGDVEVHILSTVHDEDIDLAVMGFHRRGMVGSWIAGSVAETILKSADVPVLMVGRPVRRPDRHRILLATDLSESADRLANYGFELAQETHSGLIAVNAVEVAVEGGAEAAVYLSKTRIEEAREKMTVFEKQADREMLAFETVVVESAATDAILESAANRAVDLIVIGVQTNHLTGFNVLGTTAQRVIHESPVPVIAVPQQRRDLKRAA